MSTKQIKPPLPQQEPAEERGILYGKNAVTELLKSGSGADTVWINSEENEKIVPSGVLASGGPDPCIQTPLQTCGIGIPFRCALTCEFCSAGDAVAETDDSAREKTFSLNPVENAFGD